MPDTVEELRVTEKLYVMFMEPANKRIFEWSKYTYLRAYNELNGITNVYKYYTNKTSDWHLRVLN